MPSAGAAKRITLFRSVSSEGAAAGGDVAGSGDALVPASRGSGAAAELAARRGLFSAAWHGAARRARQLRGACEAGTRVRCAGRNKGAATGRAGADAWRMSLWLTAQTHVAWAVEGTRALGWLPRRLCRRRAVNSSRLLFRAQSRCFPWLWLSPACACQFVRCDGGLPAENTPSPPRPVTRPASCARPGRCLSTPPSAACLLSLPRRHERRGG